MSRSNFKDNNENYTNPRVGKLTLHPNRISCQNAEVMKIAEIMS